MKKILLVGDSIRIGYDKYVQMAFEDVAKNAPVEYHSDQTHYYTPEGTELLAGRVVETLENVLSIKGKQLDYKQLFAEAQNVIGV